MVLGIEGFVKFEDLSNNVLSADSEEKVLAGRTILLELLAAFVNIDIPFKLSRFAEKQSFQVRFHVDPPQSIW